MERPREKMSAFDNWGPDTPPILQTHNRIQSHTTPPVEKGLSYLRKSGVVYTVPNLKGDPKYSERGPKGDLILSKKGI